jgi:hypothetical protein
MTVASFGAAISPSTKGALARQTKFALTLYPLAAVAGIAISFGSALLGYPLVTLEPPAPSAGEMTIPSPIPLPLPPTPIDIQTPSDPSVPDGPGMVSDLQNGLALKRLVYEYAKQAGQAKLAGQPKVGDTVPAWVDVKPLPPKTQPQLIGMGMVAKGSQPAAVFLYAEDAFIVNPSRQVVGVVPRQSTTRDVQ